MLTLVKHWVILIKHFERNVSFVKQRKKLLKKIKKMLTLVKHWVILIKHFERSESFVKQRKNF